MTISQPEIKRPRGRPPKNGRSADETRALLLKSGVELLTEQGFSATGIDQLLKRVGVPKGSFYHFFRSKEDYVHQVVEQYGHSFERMLNKHFSDESCPPLERLQNFVGSAASWMEQHQFRRGCIIGNLGQEIGQLPESLRAPLQDILTGWEQQLSRCLELALENGDISLDCSSAQLAHVFWIGWEGAVMRSRLEQSCEPLLSWYQWFQHSIAVE